MPPPVKTIAPTGQSNLPSPVSLKLPLTALASLVAMQWGMNYGIWVAVGVTFALGAMVVAWASMRYWLFTLQRGVLLEGGFGSVGVSAGSSCLEYVIDSWSGSGTHARCA